MAALYVALMQDFGWTLEETGNLTFIDVGFISEGWKSHPPLAAMVAGGLGIENKKPKKATKKDIQELAAFFGK